MGGEHVWYYCGIEGHAYSLSTDTSLSDMDSNKSFNRNVTSDEDNNVSIFENVDSYGIAIPQK